jgi:hypothetical protein
MKQVTTISSNSEISDNDLEVIVKQVRLDVQQ